MGAGLEARRSGNDGRAEQALDEFAAIQIGHESRLLVRVPDVNLCAVTTDSLFAWRSITPRVSLVEGNGANRVVIVDGRDVLLIDTKETGFGGALRGEVERAVGHPVTCVVSTHHHTDHVMGNAAFTADVPVTAQRRARERTTARVARALVEMATAVERGDDPYALHVADLRDWAPVSRARAARRRRSVGGRVARGGCMRRGARRRRNVGANGGGHAARRAIRADGDVRVGTRVARRRIEVELRHWGPGHTDGDVVVPGHGRVAGTESVATQRAYFERLYEAVGDALLGANLGLVYDELGQKAPEPENFSCQPE